MSAPAVSPQVEDLGVAAPSAMFAGPWRTGEFARLRHALDPADRWLTATTLAAAAEQLTESAAPELILLAQPRPGCDEQAVVQRLGALAPLTRIVAVAGSWCEGELRTGRPLSGVVRLYWYELLAWWRAALDGRARGRTPPWSEPLDDPRAARRLCRKLADPPAHSAPSRGAVVIDAVDYAVFEALSAALAVEGWSSHWRPRHLAGSATATAPEGAPIVAGVWDGGQLDGVERQELTRFVENLREQGAPTIALLDFPRGEHFEFARSAGLGAILPKPYELTLLHNALAQLTGDPNSRGLTGRR
jgi:CheY-like chemotaxis protein